MRTRTVTERIGEWFEGVDWEYDFQQHDWDHGSCVNPRCVADGVTALSKAERALAAGRSVTYSPSGFKAFPVTVVGMYDGWPFWEKTPAIGYTGPLGVTEVTFFYSLNEHNLREDDDAE